MHEIKSPVFEYLGVDSGYHLFKIYFPVVEKSADKFDFIMDGNDANAEKIIGRRGLIIRLRPEDLLFYNLDAEFVQVEMTSNSIKSVKEKEDEIEARQIKQAVFGRIIQGLGPR